MKLSLWLCGSICVCILGFDDVNSLCTVAVWSDSKNCERGPTRSKKCKWSKELLRWQRTGWHSYFRSNAKKHVNAIPKNFAQSLLNLVASACVQKKESQSDWGYQLDGKYQSGLFVECGSCWTHTLIIVFLFDVVVVWKHFQTTCLMQCLINFRHYQTKSKCILQKQP